MSFFELAINLSLIMMAVSLFIVLIRMIIGPSLEDRIIGMDLMVTIGIGIIAVYSIVSSQNIFLDIAVVMALIGFLGTSAFAYYMERKSRK
jgi:multicomponent Na+:H+ antiporter subunit F